MDTLDWEKQELFRLLKNQPGTWYQESDASQQKAIRDWIKGVLLNSEATVQFVKSDGTVRDMRCTLDYGRMPTPPVSAVTVTHSVTDIEASTTANVDGLNKTTKSRAQPGEETQRVYDLDQQAWRSFRYDRLKKITVEINLAK